MSSPLAVIVGLCAHGLTISRALARSGVDVAAIEADRSLPGCKTNSTRVEFVEDINGPGLVDALIGLAPRFSGYGRPVLILTNDSMVSTVGGAFERLETLYELSWSAQRDSTLHLLKKTAIEERAKCTDLLYPRSRMIKSAGELRSIGSDLQFPVIVKPERPISAYKTLIADTPEHLFDSWKLISTALPALVQEYVPGDEECTQFSAIYFRNGHVLARHEGRKLRSRPLGHTTIAVAERNDAIHAMTQKFFDGLNLTGPASLEFKQDPEGRYWIIEPTVGRTDFWVGLCIKDGVNLPVIEYRDQARQRQVEEVARHNVLWINEERDPTALFWLLLKHPRLLLKRRIVAVFANARDPLPFLAWCWRTVKRFPMRLIRRIKKIWAPAPIQQ